MTDRKPLLMLSLPNSGSSWLASQIEAYTSYSKYWMEFFNPLRNPRHYRQLSIGFGCELVDCYKNIAVGDYPDFDDDVRETFGQSGMNFTKEVYSPLKLSAFMRHFRCFVLLRDEADTFPPSRIRIWSFYEHAWWAFAEHSVFLSGRTVHGRALAAYRHMHETIEADALRLDVPIIQYRDLFDDSKLAETMKKCIGECPDALLRGIAQTRVLTAR
jgi:hypothetical protein